MNSNTAQKSIPHPNRDQALKRARLTAGFPNIVNGQRIDCSKRITISDPVTGEELARVTDTRKDGLDRAVQAAKAAFPLSSSKAWNERRDLLASAMEELKAHTDELCAILTAEGGRPYGMAQFEVTWILETYAPALLQMELPDSTWNETGVGQITKRYVPLGVVAAISPWNLPFWLSFIKVLPALLTGNTVVLKPAVFTPLTVLRAADYIREILPPGVLNVISGREVVLRKLRKRDGPSVGLKIGSFSASYSEQATHEPRLACRIFLCYQPDPALSNHVDRLDTL